MKSKLILALLATTIAGSALAQVKPEDAIKYRQSAYGFAAWNMGKLKQVLDAKDFNKDEAIKAANAIQTVANSGMGVLYAPGTEKGVGFKETRAKAEIFTDKEGVGKVAMAFNREANELAKVAATGDAAALKVQFGKVGEACKGCHEKFRADEKK